MKFIALLSTLAALPTLYALPSQCPSQTNVGAFYFITNDVHGNYIVINDVMEDGTVKFATTKFAGGNGITTIRDPIIPDGLLGQGSVVISNQYLFTVNPASDTVAMFEIDSQEPTKLTMVGSPINSGGEFPTSVSVSSKTGNVCVLNGGKVNGVQCFSVHPWGLSKLLNTNRILGINQTTPATRDPLLYSSSQVLFSEDGSKLFVSVKGKPGNGTPGFMATWDVARDGSLSKNFVTSLPPSNLPQAPFGMDNIRGTKAVLVSDPVVGAIVFDFSKSDNATSFNVQLPGEQLSCWVTYSSKTNTYFLTDFGTNVIYEVAVTPQLNATVVQEYQLANFSVPTDIIVGTVKGNDYLYDLAPNTTAINVLALHPGGKSQIIQSYDFAPAFQQANVTYVSSSLQGAAVFVKPQFR